MEYLITLIYLGVCVCARIIYAADENTKAENVRWTSVDFKTVIHWTSKTPHQEYTVRIAEGENDWEHSRDCIQMIGSECDVSNDLRPFNRFFIADILTDNGDQEDPDYTPDEFQHTESSPFNPYRESNISAVTFSVRAVNESTVMVNITDILTSVLEGNKQLTIRDIFKRDLQYKIRYHKSESTGKKDHISELSVAEVSKLDPGQSYCFMVAVYIPNRPKNRQEGAWSQPLCTQTHGSGTHELSPGALLGVIFPIIALIIIIVVTVVVVCCKKTQKRNRPLQTSQSSAPV